MPKVARKRSRRHSAVLLSGGIDSAACVAFYKASGYRVTGIHVSHGQLASRRELVAARRVAKFYHCEFRVVRLVGVSDKTVGEITGRNAFLLSVGLLEAPMDASVLAMGIHAGTGYPDCTSQFVKVMQDVVDVYGAGSIAVGAPFVTWSKADVYKYANSQNAPIDLTWSCERGGARPCGKCLSCRDRSVIDG